MIAYTPGPWKIVERETFADNSVYPRYIVGGPDELDVCYLESLYAANSSTPGSVRREADARLIAAAPELLGAVVELLELRECGFNSVVHPKGELNVVHAARAAIAKATGAA